MTEQELAVVNNGTFIAPVASVQDALVAYQAMKEFVEGILRKDVDFGTIPGTPKPTLYKPGAEKLMRFFGVSVELDALSAVEDWTGADHDGEAFFYYRYKALAFRGDMKIAEAVGSCSSWEKKYRYRTAEIKCPECGAENIRHSKNESGWYCWAKTGGCGANFEESDTRITKQPRGMVPNPNPADLVNTIDKMAQKRAIVAAALLACNASEYFTQDIEDYTDGTFVPAKYNSHEHQGEVSEKEKPAIVGVWHKKDELPPTKDQSTEDVQDGEFTETVEWEPGESIGEILSQAYNGQIPGVEYDKVKIFKEEVEGDYNALVLKIRTEIEKAS